MTSHDPNEDSQDTRRTSVIRGVFVHTGSYVPDPWRSVMLTICHSWFSIAPRTDFYSEAPDGMKAKTAAWSKLAQSYEVPLPAVAIAFGLLPEAVTHVVCGMRSPAEVLQAIEWTEAPVPQALWADALNMGLLPDGVDSLMSASGQILPDAREN